MPYDLTNFHTNHQLKEKESFFSQLPPREFRNLANVISADYVINLQENGFLRENDGKLIELFYLFRALSIEQITRFILPQYSQEGHNLVAEMIAKLYYSYFLNVIDIESKIDNQPKPCPSQSMVLVLGPAGARFLAAKKNLDNLSDIGWTKKNLISDISYGLHNLIVTDLIIKLNQAFVFLGILKDVKVGLRTAGEFEGMLLANTDGKKLVLARPDYTFQIKFQRESELVTRLFWLEYDNGTENLDTLIKKIEDYNLACGSGRGVLGYPKQTSPLFIFNKVGRAQKFAKALLNSTKEFSFMSAPIYITDLDSVYEKSMFHNECYKVDLTQRNQDLSEQPNAVFDENLECTVIKESIFPEIYEVISERGLLPAICPPEISFMEIDEKAALAQETQIFKKYYEKIFKKDTPSTKAKATLPLFEEKDL